MPVRDYYEAKNMALQESVSDAKLPGHQNGPGDAYRHILWTAELRRRFGETPARFIAAAHEWNPVDPFFSSPPPSTQMDFHNNEIGFQIGAQVDAMGGGFEDVVRLARERINPNNNGGAFNSSDPSSGNYATWIDNWDDYLRNNGVSEADIEDLNATNISWPNITWHPDGSQEVRNFDSSLTLINNAYEKIDYTLTTSIKAFQILETNFQNVNYEDIISNISSQMLSGVTGTISEDETGGSTLNNRRVNPITGNTIETWISSSGTRNASYGSATIGVLTGSGIVWYLYVNGHNKGIISGPALDEANSWGGRRSFNDPIALDLDGDGVIQRLNKDEVDIFFGNGANNNFALDVGWIGSGEGLLAYDFNGDGLITDTSELLENGSVGAIQNLRDNYDTNGDNVLDANDAEFANFRIWQDANTNGITDAGELMTLAAAGVASINLTPVNDLGRDENGHRVLATHDFLRTDGTTGLAEEFYFDVDGANSRYVGDFEVKLETLFLSQAKGYGLLPNLHIAASQDDTLLQQMRDITNFDAANMSGFKDAVRDLVLRWSGADQQPTYLEEAGAHTNYQTIYAMYKLSGIEPGLTSGFYYSETTAQEAEKLFEVILDRYTAIFALQGPLQSAFPEAFVDLAGDTVDFGTTDFAAALTAAQTNAPTDAIEAAHFWSNFNLVGQTFATDLGTTTSAVQEAIYDQLKLLNVPEAASLVLPTSDVGADVIVGTANADVFGAGKGDDIIFAGNGDNDIEGQDGNDIIIAGDGFDTLNGGDGNDIIDGGDGNSFIAGVSGDDLLIAGSGVDVLSGGDGNDTIKAGAGEDRLVGDDGDDTLIGEDGIDRLYGGADNDTLYGGVGDDTLYGDTDDLNGSPAGEGDDTLYGGEGNDTLYGEGGDDVITGGLGNDTIIAGTGNDVIHFALGDGQDLIRYTPQNAGEKTQLVMGSGIAAVNLDIKFFGTTIVVSILGTTDEITIETSNDAAELAVDEILFDDGSSLSKTEIIDIARTITGTEDGETISGSPIDDIILGNGGNDNLYGNDGNDQVNGGDGADHIDGGNGNDTLYGGLGNDNILGNQGNDMLYGGDGADYLSGGSGDDYLEGGQGNDTLYGDAGADTLLGGDGDDTIYADDDADTLVDGGAGYDKVYFQGTADMVADASDFNAEELHGGSGNDYLTNTQGGYTYLSGEDGDDTLIAADEGSTLLGVFGNDTLIGGTGTDLLNGDRGDDTLIGNAGNDNISGGQGNDLVIGGTGNDTMSGGNDFDTLSYATFTDDLTINTQTGQVVSSTGMQDTATSFESFIGGSGDDTFLANSHPLAAFTFDGGDGSDTISYENFTQDAVFDLAAGTASTVDRTDTISNIENAIGGSGNDTLIGSSADNHLAGGLGSDTYVYNVGDGADTIQDIENTSTSDTNTIQLGAGILEVDTTFGQVGDDLVLKFANNPTDSITLQNWFLATDSNGNFFNSIDQITFDGGNGATLNYSDIESRIVYESQNITGTTGDDEITTGAGDDIINSGEGVDTIYAGAGNDYISSNQGTDTIYAGDGDDDIYAGKDDDFIDGGEGNNTINGGLGNDTIVTYAGDDIISDNGGDEMINAGDGNNTVNAGEGADIIYTGIGNDYISSNQGADTIYAGAGDDTVYGGQDDDFIDGGVGNNTINGGLGNDTIISYAGDDVISNNGGNDIIDAGDGDNTVSGGADNDTITTGSGADYILGGEGADTITSGAGNDYISSNQGADTIYAGDGDDEIYAGKDDDHIYGGTGNDYTAGGLGSDTFHFGRGDGQDTLAENGGVSDALNFLGNIDHDQLWFMQQGNDLSIQVVGTTDSVTIDNWYSSNDNKVELINAGDGYTLNSTDVDLLVQAMAAFNPPSGSETELDPAILDQLNPTLASTWQQSAA